MPFDCPRTVSIYGSFDKLSFLLMKLSKLKLARLLVSGQSPEFFDCPKNGLEFCLVNEIMTKNGFKLNTRE